MISLEGFGLCVRVPWKVTKVTELHPSAPQLPCLGSLKAPLIDSTRSAQVVTWGSIGM
jgi:hypothetical protein